MAQTLEPLIRPASVVLVGASADPSKTAGKPLGFLRKHGYTGRIYVVNPRYASIDGMPCFASVTELPEPPDVGLVLLGAEAAVEAVGELAERGARAAVVLAGGFAEIDSAGAARQAGLVRAAGEMRLLGPNTIGMVNVLDAIALSASSALELDGLRRGSLAVVSQSGGMLGALLSRGEAHGVGFSRLISTGNEADVDVCDAIEYLLQDDATRVIALYLESLRRPLRFREVATRTAESGKHLVIFKIGRSEAGAQSASSHTGAIAGTDRIYDALFARTRAIRVSTLDELIDVSAALLAAKRLGGTRLGVLTSTGGGGSLVADACGVRGFTVPPPDQPTAERLRAVLRGDGAVAGRNPIDLTLANLRSETYRDTIGALVESPTYDAVVVVVGSSGLGDPSLAAGPVVEAATGTRKPVLVYVNPHALNIVKYLNGMGVPAFATAEGCAAALNALASVSLWERGRFHPKRHPHPRPLHTEGEGTRQLNEAESLALFARHGIPVVRQHLASTPEEAERFAQALGRPVVVKAVSRSLAHKSDVGAVRVGIDPGDVVVICDELRSLAQDGWLVQEQVVGATEMLLGVIRDQQLGLTLVLGAGGIATEVFDDTVLGLLPLRDADPAEMLSELKSRVFLRGLRGRPPGDVDALLRAVQSFAAMAEALGDQLLESEINPLFVLPRGHGVLAADGLVVLRSAAG
jgi:acyl-CoA synthetase (NDP forming)